MRKITVFISMILLVVMLTACGKDMSDSPYVGKWTATSAEMGGITLDIETVVDGEFTFDLKDNGNCVATIGEDEQSGKWEETETGFIVESEFEAVVDGDTAAIDYDGLTVNMEKQ